MLGTKICRLFIYLQWEVVWTDLICASEGDHIIGLRLLGSALRLLLHEVDWLTCLQLPEARHNQLGVQEPAEHVALRPWETLINTIS